MRTILPLLYLLFMLFFSGRKADAKFVVPYDPVCDTLDMLRIEHNRARVDDACKQQEFAESHFNLIDIKRNK